jgi:hypothetical protein
MTIPAGVGQSKKGEIQHFLRQNRAAEVGVDARIAEAVFPVQGSETLRRVESWRRA